MGTSGSGSTDDVSDAITADTLGLASGTKIVTATSKDTSVAKVTDEVKESADVAADAAYLGQVAAAASTNASAGTYIKSFKITAVGAGSTYIDVKIIDTATSTESHKYIPVKVSSDKKLKSKTEAAIKSEVTDKNPDENEGGAADAVIAKINAIGTVAYTDESKARIKDARAAYDALTEAQKALVPAETLALLTAAESTYAELKAAAGTSTGTGTGTGTGTDTGSSASGTVFGTEVWWGNGDITGSGNSFTKDDVTITAGNIDFANKNFTGGGEFTTTLGNFTRIEVVTEAPGFVSGEGWSGSTGAASTGAASTGAVNIWTGNASSVSFSGPIEGCIEFIFTIE